MDPAPSQDDINFFVVVLHQVSSLWKSFVMGGFAVVAGFIWRASSKYREVELALRDHAERLEKNEAAIRALEAGHQQIAIKLESLPTRGEMNEQFRSVRDDIRSVRGESLGRS